MKKAFFLLATCGSLSLMILAGGVGGCGGDSGSGLEGEEGTTASETEASSAADGTAAMIEAVMALMESGSLSGLTVSDTGSLVVDPQKLLTVTEVPYGDCPPYAIPSVSTSLGTINGADLDSAGSGSCTIKGDSTDYGSYAQVNILLECDSFNGGEVTENVTFDGKIGIVVNATSSGDTSATAAIYVGSEDLMIGFREDGSMKLCDVVLGTDQTITYTIYDTYMTYANVIDGCISVCGDSYYTTGTRTGTYNFNFE